MISKYLKVSTHLKHCYCYLCLFKTYLGQVPISAHKQTTCVKCVKGFPLAFRKLPLTRHVSNLKLLNRWNCQSHCHLASQHLDFWSRLQKWVFLSRENIEKSEEKHTADVKECCYTPRSSNIGCITKVKALGKLVGIRNLQSHVCRLPEVF